MSLKENEPEVQSDAEELASMLAGYNNTRGAEPPVDEVPEVVEDTTTDEAPLPAPDPEPTVVNLAEELKALKAKVAATNSDPDAVRRLHGEIGNINRTLLQLQTPAPSPVIDADDAELDASVEEYPELAGPLVKKIRSLEARLSQQPAQQAPEDFDDRVSATVTKIREKDAIEALTEEHPDFQTVRDTPQYKTWLASKPPEFQTRFNTTWNPAVVARGLTEFKDSLKKRDSKQHRLAAAVTPQGVSQPAGPSTLPDEAGLLVGYNRGPKRHR